MMSRRHEATCPSVLVIGASGMVGSQIIKELGERHKKSFRIIAGVFQESKKLAQPAAVREELWKEAQEERLLDGDYPETINFTNIQLLCIVPDSEENRVQHVQTYVERAKQAGTSFILLISGIVGDKSYFGKQFKEMEQFVAKSGLNYSILRCTMFQQDLFFHKKQIQQTRTISLPLRDSEEDSIIPVNIIDIAKCTASILLQPEAHNKVIYHLAGPRAVNIKSLAEIASKSLRIPISFQSCSKEEYVEMLRVEHGMKDWQANGLLDILEHAKYSYLRTIIMDNIFSSETGTTGIAFDAFFGNFTFNVNRLVDWIEMNKRFFLNDGDLSSTLKDTALKDTTLKDPTKSTKPPPLQHVQEVLTLLVKDKEQEIQEREQMDKRSINRTRRIKEAIELLARKGYC